MTTYPDQTAPDRIGKFTAGSALLHLAIAASFLLYAFINGHLHRDIWGSNTQQGSIEATLVSSAPAIPLPQEPTPTPSVLATQTPSQAPAPAAAPPKPAQDTDAVPIPVKQPPPKQAAKKEATPQPKQPPQDQTHTRASKYAQQPPQQHRANFGEAAPQMSRSMTSTQGPNNPVNIKGNDFGSQFPYYVDVIKRTVARNWYQQEVQPTTPAGSRVYLAFSVSRDGTPSNIRVQASSNSPSLDTSCMRAVQRVDTFGALPAGYNQSSISVEYYCEYAGPNR